jgi:hypothetical protein
VNNAIIWNAATIDLVPLRGALEELLRGLETGSGVD